LSLAEFAHEVDENLRRLDREQFAAVQHDLALKVLCDSRSQSLDIGLNRPLVRVATYNGSKGWQWLARLWN
jgi:hypothetical protein